MTEKPKNNSYAPPESVPDQAHIVLVPLANPNTAGELLKLAAGLVHPEEGRIVGLIVSLGNVEKDAEVIAKLEAAVEELKEAGYKCSLRTEVATTIARGILDTAREVGADLIILGIKERSREKVELGTIAESVLDTAPCDVLIYRSAINPGFSRVVIPIDSGYQTQVAARVGIRLAKHYETKVEALYSQGGQHTQFEGLAKIEQAIAHVPGQNMVKRTVVTAANPVESVLSRTDEDDMIVVGFNDRNELDRWMFGDVSRGVFNRAPGPVIMVSRAPGGTKAHVRWQRRALSWLRPVLTRVEQDEIIRTARDTSSITIDYVVLIHISATIATLGLLLNSAAVIIGAMLVAPFISPLIALAAGVTVGRVFMASRALVTVAFGVGFSILVAFLIGYVLPVDIMTSEMLSRGTPTLLDAGVAFASGIVGAYATARKDIPAALAGVAIAAALMPPLCTVGLGLAYADFELAFGAFVLFLTNILCIMLAGVGVFVWLGMTLRRYDHIAPFKQAIAVGLLVLASIPVAYELVQLTRQVNQEAFVQEYLASALAPAEVVDFELRRGDPARVLATVRTATDLEASQLNGIQDEIAATLDKSVTLELITLRIISLTGDEPIEDSISSFDQSDILNIEFEDDDENSEDSENDDD